MADTRSIVITLKLDNGSSSTNPTETTDTSTVESEMDKNNALKSMAWALSVRAVEVAANEVIAWAEYEWDKQLSLTDDYIGQRWKRIATTQISRGISAISSVASMTAWGAAAGGSVGAAIGAGLGVTMSIASMARSNIQGKEQQDIHIRQMEAQLGFTRSRAGWSTQAGSIGEDL